MDARWMPLLAAGLGVLGGLGGAVVGGWLANEGQENQFESERAAAAQDLRREAYGIYLGAAQEVWATDLEEGSEDEKDAAAVRLFVAEARIRLVAENDNVWEAAMKLKRC